MSLRHNFIFLVAQRTEVITNRIAVHRKWRWAGRMQSEVAVSGGGRHLPSLVSIMAFVCSEIRYRHCYWGSLFSSVLISLSLDLFEFYLYIIKMHLFSRPNSPSVKNEWALLQRAPKMSKYQVVLYVNIIWALKMRINFINRRHKGDPFEWIREGWRTKLLLRNMRSKGLPKG